MNALKNILFFGLLLAVLYGVYLSLNRAPDNSPLPPGLSAVTTPANVNLGQEITPTANISGPPSGNMPGFPLQPPINTQSTNTLGAAPPFQPAGAGPTNIALPPPPGGFCALGAPPSERPAETSTGSNIGPTVRRDAVDANTSSPPLTPPPADHLLSARVEGIMQQVKMQVEERQFDNALMNLSQLYGNSDLPPSQSREITLLLDQLAAKVIYSREHLLEKDPYLVRGGDTLESIADRYQVPALLLAKINGIRDWQNLPPGRELKVLKGPFSAHISTDRSEMTLMLDGRYAGRFNLVLSSDLNHAVGFCRVREKSPPPAVADSRLHKQWIELENTNGKISMQGTNDTSDTSRRDSRGTIWLSEQDMDDVSAILSVGSRVIIQR